MSQTIAVRVRALDDHVESARASGSLFYISDIRAVLPFHTQLAAEHGIAVGTCSLVHLSLHPIPSSICMAQSLPGVHKSGGPTHVNSTRTQQLTHAQLRYNIYVSEKAYQLALERRLPRSNLFSSHATRVLLREALGARTQCGVMTDRGSLKEAGDSTQKT